MSAEAAGSLAALPARCFQGVIPSLLATADADGVPNVTYISQVHLVDDGHVALSRQFFNKTSRNLDANPQAAVELYDPVTFEAWRLRLRFLRTETSGPTVRHDGAAHPGDRVAHRHERRLLPPRRRRVRGRARGERRRASAPAPARSSPTTRSRCRGTARSCAGCSGCPTGSTAPETSERCSTPCSRRSTRTSASATRWCSWPTRPRGRLVALGSRGYGETGIGAEVAVGDGLDRHGGARAARAAHLRTRPGPRVRARGPTARCSRREPRGRSPAEIPLPGLPDARSALVIPLVVRDHLVGVLAAESRDPMAFDEWHEAYLEVLGNQIALGLERMLEPARRGRGGADDRRAARLASPTGRRTAVRLLPQRRLRLRRRRVPDPQRARPHPVEACSAARARGPQRASPTASCGSTESLGLPAFRDNLESRLVLLRRRLEQKCPDVRLVSTGRGRFDLVVAGQVELEERDSA